MKFKRIHWLLYSHLIVNHKTEVLPLKSFHLYELLQKIQKDLVDKVVLEGHIVPHKMLFTSHAPTQEYPTVAWLPKGIQVNVSLQLTGFQSSSDSSFRNPNLDNPGRISYSSYSVNQDGDETLNQDQQRALELQEASPVVVRSNTIVGDRVHPRGMVVARIVQGNIPVQNGVVHLIDKPLMVVANSLYEYIMVMMENIDCSKFFKTPS